MPSDVTPPRRLFEQLGSPTMNAKPVAAVPEPEAGRAPTVGPDLASSVVSGPAQGLGLSQSKSDLYRVKEEFLFIFS